jgi:cytochrome c oxidase subunit 4
MGREPERSFIRVYLWLWLLLAGTAGAAFVHLGAMNIVIALLIAGIQTALIALYFMQLRQSNHLNWIVAIASLLWLGIMFTLVIGDYATRNWTGR